MWHVGLVVGWLQLSVSSAQVWRVCHGVVGQIAGLVPVPEALRLAVWRG